MKLPVTVTGLLASVMLWGCASEPAPTAVPTASTSAPGTASPAASLPNYRCEHNIEFSARFVDDTAVLDVGSRGREVLLRDAGGLTPQQTVFSNDRLRAEFGLGPTGRDAILRYLSPPLVANCVRE
jgi:hypothetical protein